MVKKLYSNESGISVTELLVVLVLASILVTFAVAQFGNARESFTTQNLARELKVNFERSRFDSVKRRPTDVANQAKVVIESATKFSVYLDRDNDGVINNTTDKREVILSNSGDNLFLLNGLSLPVEVKFDHRGQATATDSVGNTVTPKFIICDACTDTTASSTNAYIVEISATGTIAMYGFGETPASLIDPTVGTISPTGDIDPMMTYGNGGAAPLGTPAITPTPDPSPSATPLPTASPTATPDPTASPSATPTPTQQDICYRNERPSDSGCICQSPMWVRGNGQCK